jgi:hypothetical protein
MKPLAWDTWLPWLCRTATFVFVAALCLAVAVLVIAFIPGSPVTVELPGSVLSGLDRVRDLAPGVVVKPAARVDLSIVDASLGRRLLFAATSMPGLILVSEIARRMSRLLRTAQSSDPFTARTARELTVLARITAAGGLVVWAVASLAAAGLTASVLASAKALESQWTPLGWLSVALIFAALGQLVARGVAMRAELDTVI